jgi:hypothetical protein
MKLNSFLRRRYARRSRTGLTTSLSLGLFITVLVAFTSLPSIRAYRAPGSPAQPLLEQFAPFAGENCASAPVINPAALPFSDESSTVGAQNDIDPGFAGCVPGLGPDVVYSFTPSATDTYTIAATPSGQLASTYDVSLYVVTDCLNAAGTCVAGANARAAGDGEFLTPTLNAGTTYFIVVDSPNGTGQGAFHFSLRRGTPSNDSCSTPVIIDPTQLPVTISGSTFGATNDSNPGSPCLPSSQSGSGPDVLYQFTSNDTQNYDFTVTPTGNFDVSIYIVADCLTDSSCKGADVHGAGQAETIRRSVSSGTTFFIIIDGRQADAGDFTLTVVPTEPHSPAPATNLSAHAVSSTEIDLTWDDNSTNESGFRVQRSLDGATFNEIDTTGPNVTSFNDTGLTPETTYFYRVIAFNNFGNADPSNVAADTTPAPPVPEVPVLTITPDSVDFGSVQVLESSTRTVTLANEGGSDLVISAISDPSSPFSIVDRPTLPLTISPEHSVDLTVKFAPLGVTSFASSFSVSSSDPEHPSLSVSLAGAGAGTPIPDLIITPEFIDFPGGSSVQLVEIRNAGAADLVIGNIQPPKAPFSLSGLPPLPATVKPGEILVFSVNFSAPAPGFYQGLMNIINNDPDVQFLPVRMQGTSTPQNELLKLRAPVQPTVVIGMANTLNVIAVNGTNTNITLSASSVPGGVFTDNGGGRGDLVITPTGTSRTTTLMTFTARDSTGVTKTLTSLLTIVPLDERVGAQISLTAPETAPNPPANLVVVDNSITPLSIGTRPFSGGLAPSAAAGLAGYAIYRFSLPGQAPSLGSIVAVIPSNVVSFTDSIAAPSGSSFLSSSAYYIATAIYSSGIESSASNESSTAPRMVDLRFKKKQIRFQRANSNVETGATLLVDGRETFAIEVSGDLIIVGKKTRSTPGNLVPKQIFSSGSHTVQVRNPHGQVSAVANLSK